MKINWHEYFEYIDGHLFWLLNRRGPVKKGDRVKNIDGKGYVRVMVNRKFYLAHRVIYEMHHGEIQEGHTIDHIDGDRLNNRIENLRSVTMSVNLRNRGMQSNNKSGFTGVYYAESLGKWIASIGKTRLGKFTSFDEAKRARLSAIKSDPSYTSRHGV
ncbi:MULTISPECIES: HNH endonuclease signature motif containing protein [unclassified Providencia]|uniref:HNH endonuclease signature motif containing protein n=1 Tax=unclassified Providencia TaxID=2633465 RepID=UPI00234BC74A|nr:MULTISPECIES: HNH endonuclease signature motif containing protein [unclassified Providencia]